MEEAHRSVLVDHRLMIQTLPVGLRQNLKRFLPPDTFMSITTFVCLALIDWDAIKLNHLNWLLKDLYFFFIWKRGMHRNKYQTFSSEEAINLMSKLRVYIFESYATVHHVNGIPEDSAYFVKFPPSLIDNLFPVYSSMDLIYLKERLKREVVVQGTVTTDAHKKMFPENNKERKPPQWVKVSSKKVKKESIEIATFEDHRMATAYYGSSASSRCMKVGHEDPILKYDGNLVEIFMHFVWAVCTTTAYNREEAPELAFRFYFLASQSQWKTAEDRADFFVPDTYGDSIQSPHVDYSHTRNLRVRNRDEHDLWSMDLPLTLEGCTLLLWPSTGPGVPIHVKHGEMLVRSSKLIHSGGIPGRFNGDAFRLHGALGSIIYIHEMDGIPATVKEDPDKVSYYVHHTFPTAETMIRAVMDRY